MKSVILPGSSDPVTLGHIAVIREAAKRFDEVYVVAFVNPEKSYTFTAEDRVKMLLLATDEFDNVMVSYSDGLVIDYMRDHGIEKIFKGYRNDTDLAYERAQAEWNLAHGGYETELWKCPPEIEDISSSNVRELILSGGRLDGLLSPEVVAFIISKSETPVFLENAQK